MRPPANSADRSSRDRAAAARTVHHVHALSIKAPYRAPAAKPARLPRFAASSALPRFRPAAEVAAARKRAEVAELVAEVRADGRVQSALLLQKRKAEHAAKFGAGPVSTARARLFRAGRKRTTFERVHVRA